MLTPAWDPDIFEYTGTSTGSFQAMVERDAPRSVVRWRIPASTAFTTEGTTQTVAVPAGRRSIGDHSHIRERGDHPYLPHHRHEGVAEGRPRHRKLACKWDAAPIPCSTRLLVSRDQTLKAPRLLA